MRFLASIACNLDTNILKAALPLSILKKYKPLNGHLMRCLKCENANQNIEPTNDFLPSLPIHLGPPVQDEKLHQEQMQLSYIIENASDYADAKNQLLVSSLAHSARGIEQWEPAMLETVIAIAQKWK